MSHPIINLSKISSYQQLNDLYIAESEFYKTAEWALHTVDTRNDQEFKKQTGFTFDELVEEMIHAEETMLLLEDYAKFARDIETHILDNI